MLMAKTLWFGYVTKQIWWDGGFCFEGDELCKKSTSSDCRLGMEIGEIIQQRFMA